MTQDEIIRMARECLIYPSIITDDNGTGMYATFEVYKASIESLQRFAALVAAHVAEVLTKSHEESFKAYVYQAKADRELEALRAQFEEREACAKVCDERVDFPMLSDAHVMEALMCAAAIRARGEK